MIAARELHLVLVTPETTLMQEPVRSLQVPFFDGSAGILPGHTAMVARLGAGKLTVNKADGSSEEFFVDGGFAQVKGQVVSLLTQRCLPIAEVDPSAAKEELEAALAMPGVGDEQIEARQRAQDRARRMAAIGRR